MFNNVTGQALDYDSFKSAYDTTPELAELVSSYNSKGITLNTRDKQKQSGQSEKSAVSTTDAMASRAAKKMMGR